jgi:perosamine synthetase
VSGRQVPAARIVFSAEDRRSVLALIDESLQSGSLTLGHHTAVFEEQFAGRHHGGGAVAVSSGTAALEIVLRGIGVEGGEVVVPTNTFFATAAAVVRAGATPRFADVAPGTMALSRETLEAAITPATVAAVAVHIGGAISPDIYGIAELCNQRRIALVEDAAHAHGSALDGRPAGSFGRAAAFSFYPTKVMTSGEGGMILTGDESLREDAVVYRDQGKSGFHGGDHIRMGYAWRMSELHAAVGIVQLRRLDQFIATRRLAAAVYDEGLAGVDGIEPLPMATGCEPNYYKYVALLAPDRNRDEVKTRLRDRHQVSLSGEVYALPLHRQPVFSGMAAGYYPVADDVCARHICLPIHSDMSRDEAGYVVDSLVSVLAGTRPTTTPARS